MTRSELDTNAVVLSPQTKTRRRHDKQPTSPLASAHGYAGTPPPSPPLTPPSQRHESVVSPPFFGLIQELVSHDPWMLLIATCLLNQTPGRRAVPTFWQLLHRWPTPHALATADVEELTTLLRPLGLHNLRARRLVEFSRAWLEAPPRDDVVYQSRVPRLVPGRRKVRRRDEGKDKVQGEGVGSVSDRRRRRRDPQQVPGPTREDAAGRRAEVHDDDDEGSYPYPPTPVSHLPGVGRYALDSWRIFVQGGGSQFGEPRPRAWQLEHVEARAREYRRRRAAAAGDDATADEAVAAASATPRPRRAPTAVRRSKYFPGSSRPNADGWERRDASSERAPWRAVRPQDKELRAYLVWRWARERKRWDPHVGAVVGELDDDDYDDGGGGGGGGGDGHGDGVGETALQYGREPTPRRAAWECVRWPATRRGEGEFEVRTAPPPHLDRRRHRCGGGDSGQATDAGAEELAEEVEVEATL